MPRKATAKREKTVTSNITTREKKVLSPKTNNQVTYIASMAEADITFCVGPAGSGKTCIAVGLACEYLLAKKVSKIIISRPVVESGHGLGFLPGDMNAKTMPYMVPIIEEMNAYLGRDIVTKYRENDVIEICPLEYMRGRNFHGCFMILDEAQNATFDQIKMFITRIGIDSKAVINGDTEQTDLKRGVQGGLIEFTEKLAGLEGVAICQLDTTDIVRNPIIAKVLERLKNAQV